MPRELIGFLAAFCVAGCSGSGSGRGTTAGGGGTTNGGRGGSAGAAGSAGTTNGGCGTTGSRPGTTGSIGAPGSAGGGNTDGGGGSVEGFVLVEPGTFTMGSPAGERGRADPQARGFVGSAETQHQVTLTRGFYLQRTEVTRAQWRARMGDNPSVHFDDCGESCPVALSRWDAFAYANAMSAAEGLAECYTLTGCSKPNGTDVACTGVTVNATGGNPYLCMGYRLPTEAEWEYAYRAGTTTAFYNGGITQTGCCPVDPNLDAIGWFCGNAGGRTHPVAQKAANAWGLYDMAGNVWEMVWDVEGDYPSSPVTDPVGPGSGSYVRGGSWRYGAENARAAGRAGGPYDDGNYDPTGFRLARSAPLAPGCTLGPRSSVPLAEPVGACSGRAEGEVTPRAL